MPPPTTEWRSCCLQVDPRAVAYFTQMIIGIGVLVFAGAQLVLQPSCVQQQAYLGLFTFIIGILLHAPSMQLRGATPPASIAAPTAELEQP